MLARSDDFKIEVDSAALTLGAMAIEVEDMLMRLPSFNDATLKASHPHELLALSHALADVRSAFLDLEQSVRERRFELAERGEAL